MYEKTLSQIITLKTLKNSYALISKKSIGLDQVSVELFEEDLNSNLQDIVDDILKNRYTPEPLSRIYIPKQNSTEFRPLGLGALKDKIVQKALSLELSSYFEKEFSDSSYGYRINKGTLKAISRVKDYLQRGFIWIYRFDIDNFFETISHQKLLSLLSDRIEDKAIINLIYLFLKNGSFERYRYIEHFEGIHQGDPLSPLLANIYLNQLDWFLQNNAISFVRFADDIVVFSHNKKQLLHYKKEIDKFLTNISISSDPNKSKISHAIKDGFDFLGLKFKGFEVEISKKKLDEIILKQSQITKNIHPFNIMIDKLNDYFTGLKRYYFKIIDENHPQFKLIQEALLLALSKRVYLEKKRGLITTKRAFTTMLLGVEFAYEFSLSQKKNFIKRVISRGFEEYLAQNTYKKSRRKISKKRADYAKRFALSSVLYISEVGTFLGVAKNTIVLKQKGKVIYKIPKYSCERIVIATTSISLSGALVKLCAELGIAVDFIDQKSQTTPYASLYANRNSYAKLSIKQLEILNTPLQLKLAKTFVKGKVKNQLNYLKYLNKYHTILDSEIEAMETKLNNMLKNAKTTNEIMGYEGQSSLIYWQGLSKVVDDKVVFSGRVTMGAKDLVNSLLNYGYALLYSRVRYHAVKAGLALHISFLHALDDNKPTLIYDMIEEFRAFVVDRVVFTLINQNQHLKIDKDGKLDVKTRQLLTRKILEKIGSYTKHKKATKKIDTIIEEQAYLLARAIRGIATYRAFIGKY